MESAVGHHSGTHGGEGDDGDYHSHLTETELGWTFIGHSDCRPVNEFDALMRCAAFEWPEPSRAERLPLRDVIVDAIDSLGEEERWVFDALFVGRQSLRQLAREIAVPKTTLARRRDALLVVLREKLLASPEIVDYLERNSV